MGNGRLREAFRVFPLNRPLFAGDPEVRILSNGKDQVRNALTREALSTSGADGFGSQERVSEQIGRTLVDLSAGCIQHGQPAHLGQAAGDGYRSTRLHRSSLLKVIHQLG